MKTSEIIRHIFNKTSVMDREVQARIMTAALDYIATGDMRVEGDKEIFMIECFMPMLDEARRNDETLSEKRSRAGKESAKKRWNKQEKNNTKCVTTSRARAINEPQYIVNKLKSLEDNFESDNNFDRDKLKSLEDNFEESIQVIDNPEDKLRDSNSHAREKNSAPQVPTPENAATVRKPETMEDKRAKCGMRKQKFKEELDAYMQSYPADMLRDFFDYWTEMNKSRTMMRFEQQKTWELRLRLATWARRDEARGKPRKRGSTIMEAVSAVARSIEDDKKNGKRIDFNKLLNG